MEDEEDDVLLADALRYFRNRNAVEEQPAIKPTAPTSGSRPTRTTRKSLDAALDELVPLKPDDACKGSTPRLPALSGLPVVSAAPSTADMMAGRLGGYSVETPRLHAEDRRSSVSESGAMSAPPTSRHSR